MSIELKYNAALSGKQHRIIHTSATNNSIKITGNLNPSLDLGYSVGTSLLRWDQCFVKSIDISGIVFDPDITITGGEGLTGGGNLSANRIINMDINGLSANTAPDGFADFLAIYDVSDGIHKKVLLNNLPGADGEQNTASNQGAGGVGVFIQKTGLDLEFKNINAGDGIGVTDDVGNAEIDITLDINGMLEDNNPNVNVDFISTYSTTAAGHTKVLLGNVTSSFLNFQQISDETITTTTAVIPIFTQKISLTTNTLLAGGYCIAWYYEWRYTNLFNDFVARVQINNTTTIMEHQQEPKDVGADQSYPVSGFRFETLSGVNSIDLDFARSVAVGTAFIRRARLSVWRVT